MSILPRPERGDEPPPAVAHLRDRIRGTRLARWIVRHKNVASAAAALAVLLKLSRYFVSDLVLHPERTLHWAVSHALLVGMACAAIFVVAFTLSRLGIEWLREDEDAPRKTDFGPGWSDRPRNRPADTHIPHG